MSLMNLRRALAAGAILSAVFVAQAVPVDAATGPTVIAVHRSGAVDISGESTYGSIARMSVPAGNWLITATATIQSTQSVLAVYCQLVAGNDSYVDRTDPERQGPGSLGAMVLLLAHHFAKAGAVILKCQDTDWLGDILIRDVHVTAVEVGQLTSGGVTYGSGSPSAVYGQDWSQRLYFDTNDEHVQQLALPTGTWLVQAAGWGLGLDDGDRVDCSLQSSSSTVDSLIEDFNDIAGRSIGLEGIVTVSGRADSVTVHCKDTDANWSIRGSAISALKIGTLQYGHFGSTLTTTGSGSPTVIGAYSDDAGAVSEGQAPQSIANVSIPSGSWFLTSHVSLLSDALSGAVTTCRLQLGGAVDQGRVYLDASNYSIGWLGSSLTKKVSSASNASLACGESSNSYEVLFLHDKIFAIKAGTLTDTLLE